MIAPSGACPTEAETFLAAHPHINAIDLVLSDVNGIARGKIIRRHELMALYRDGRLLPASILGLDICGEDVHETGLVWECGDGDVRAWPVAGSLVPLHGTTRAEVLLQVHHLDGSPMLADPRHALQRQVDLLAADGLHPAAAFELEFFLLDPNRGPDGALRPAPAVLDGRTSHRTEVYSVDHLQGMIPLFDDIYAGAELAGIKAETMISEFAPGQYELTLAYRTSVVKAADDLARMKRIVRAQARAHGVVACFMAKPFAGVSGSGMHLHISLNDDEGRNMFAETAEGEWSDRIRHAIGGLQATMDESMLVFAPHANSWRRFTAESYAPIAPTWGVNNRSVAFRIPAGGKNARRIEHRPSGVDAQPTLVAATVLAAMRHGMTAHIDPGPEVTGNGYANPPSPTMPADWREAIGAAQRSAFLRDALGHELHRVFCAIKSAELARVSAIIPDVDLDLYMHSV
ncbi:glutamine synthetase family protein [Falsirhodobacter sp. alg1]|uniref:glutamine synthetase family protein n=1 Tax=Falsirhodobacter sp. alg1 TaxID=1472418 RepID=UPI0005EF995F|nr:glutamine synthetase family protein [Falsirhodobacter sp. alg1]